jgi:hypothetical protein
VKLIMTPVFLAALVAAGFVAVGIETYHDMVDRWKRQPPTGDPEGCER